MGTNAYPKANIPTAITASLLTILKFSRRKLMTYAPTSTILATKPTKKTKATDANTNPVFRLDFFCVGVMSAQSLFKQ
jgi:hypothetical protein